jgi:hypothetical protein
MASSAPCFVTGTRIAVVRGEIAVEGLTLGDEALLHDGGTASVVWVGHRFVDCGRHPRPDLVWPVRVLADAFGPGEPRRALFLSPDHAVFVEGALVPVKYLINGSSIAQVRVAEVTYHHVELAVHGVLIAEGLAAESYLDTGDRSNFDNGGGVTTLHPNFATLVREGLGCADLVVLGPVVERVRRRLAERAPIACRTFGMVANYSPAGSATADIQHL